MGCLSVLCFIVGGFLIYVGASTDLQMELTASGIVMIIIGLIFSAINKSIKKSAAEQKSNEQAAKINAIRSKYAHLNRDQKIMRLQHISRQMQALEVEIGVENLKTDLISVMASDNLHKQYMELKFEYEVLESLL